LDGRVLGEGHATVKTRKNCQPGKEHPGLLKRTDEIEASETSDPELRDRNSMEREGRLTIVVILTFAKETSIGIRSLWRFTTPRRFLPPRSTHVDSNIHDFGGEEEI
jgi:hypothetical protein